MGPSLRFHWGNSQGCNPTCIYFFSIHSTSWIKICKIFMNFAKFGNFPAFTFFNWNLPQLFQGMDSQRNLLYSFFQSFLFWSDWMLSIGLAYCCHLKPTVESKMVKEFCFFVFIIFNSKISISLINNFSIFYFICDFVENVFLSIHFKGVCPYLLKYLYRVAISFSQIDAVSQLFQIWCVLMVLPDVSCFSDSFYAKKLWIVYSSFWIDILYETVSCLNAMEHLAFLLFSQKINLVG